MKYKSGIYQQILRTITRQGWLPIQIMLYTTTYLKLSNEHFLNFNKLYYMQVKQKRIILIYFGKSNAHISSFFLVFTQNLSQYSPDFRKNTAPHASHWFNLMGRTAPHAPPLYPHLFKTIIPSFCIINDIFWFWCLL